MTNTDESEIYEIIQTYFEGLSKHDRAWVSKTWSKNGRLFINGDVRDLTFFDNIPPFVGFALDESALLSVDEKIAVVKVSWRMMLPDTTGRHVSYISLFKEAGRWCILSKTDYGIEDEI